MPNITITHIKGRLPGYGESQSLITTIHVSPKARVGKFIHTIDCAGQIKALSMK